MDSIPAERHDDDGPRIAPLFPLPNVYLFPGCVMPLHIFEPRYRQMIEDLLDGPGRLVMGTQLEEGAALLEGSLRGLPPVMPTAGLGEIARHERMSDGRFLIYVVGLKRVHIREMPSDRMYRKVEVDPIDEIAVPPEKADKLRTCLRTAVLERCSDLMNLPPDVPIAFLADLLLQRLHLPPSAMQRLYCECDVKKRAEGVLEEHYQRRPPSAGSQRKLDA